MNRLRSLGIAAGLLAFACAAYAYPTLSGPSGGAALPEASVVPSGQLQLAADYYDTRNTYDMSSAVSGLLPTGNAYPARALMGFGQFELGGSYTDQTINVSNVNAWGANLKFGTPLTVAGVAVAAGATYNTAKVTDVFGTSTKPSTWEGYLVGDLDLHSLGIPDFKGTLGANWVQFRDTDLLKSAGGRVMAAVSASLTRNIILGLEYQTARKDVDVKPVSSVYARFAANKLLGAQVGFSNVSPDLGQIGINKHELFAGLDLSFGGR